MSFENVKHQLKVEMDRARRIVFLLLIVSAIFSCTRPDPRKPAMFIRHDSDHTGVTFANDLEHSETLNPYTFRSFYNGGGIGLGDFNNDGLLDIFFAGNMVASKLYLNKGGFQFSDITEQAGLPAESSWTTGVSVVDINGDGWLDLYLCKSGPPGGTRRKNELFINNGDLTFTEAAHQYGLDFEGLSVHAAFFDYDRDGDLDCYLLNNSIRSVGGYDLRKDQRNIPDPLGGNKLLRNDNGVFTDVTTSAGIYSSMIGFGLGVTVGDINKDGWQDMFVSNDFFEKDYLYLNNGNGTFRECLEDHIREISLGSMGADMADLNNDALPDIYVTEMLPERDDRLKTTSQFESWDKFTQSYEMGYYRQFSRNVLQMNNGDGTFSEISRYAGVHATDWSWGALIFDMDNDGLKDIFVANGVYKDLLNQDYVSFIADPATVRDILRKERAVVKRLVDSIPSNRIPNYAFRNRGNMMFTNEASAWGLDEPSHSNGSVYGDLDNDGDLDLVLSNVNMPAFIYENTAAQSNGNNTLSVSLTGAPGNPFALGAKVTLYDSGRIFYQEVSPMRGFMSTVDTRLHFGIGNTSEVDSLVVDWPDGTRSRKVHVAAGRIALTQQADSAYSKTVKPAEKTTTFKKVNIPGASFRHEENNYVDFDRDRLLFNMSSNEGPCFCKGDINNDGLDDFYIGGAKGQRGRLFVQRSNGSFTIREEPVMAADEGSEDMDCVFFDADGDGRQDLFVASGGSEFSPNSAALLDRLYFNRGNRFEKSNQPLPSSLRFESTSTVSATDFDGDGHTDLFIGVRLRPFQYGLPASSYLLKNDGKGRFQDVTSALAPGLTDIGMVTDSQWADVNRDGLPDLIIVGEWMPVTVFLQEDGKLVNRSGELGFAGTQGWYHAIDTGDFNGDGYVDIVAGNHGLNSRFKASADEPVSMYINDFDANGTLEQITTYYDNGRSYPLVLRTDLLTQIPSLKKKYLHYRSYKGKTINDMFTSDVLDRSVRLDAHTFASSVWINGTGKSFHQQRLPWQAQLFPVYCILSGDFDGDGSCDLLVGGNLCRAKPETGFYDAGYGLFLKGDGTGQFEALEPGRSGVQLPGEMRRLATIRVNRKKLVSVVTNNDSLKFLTY